MPGYDNHRYRLSPCFQLTQEFDAVDPRHAHVGNNAAPDLRRSGCQECRRGIMQPDGKVGSRKQEAQGFSDIGIIIDHVDDIIGHFGRRPLSPDVVVIANENCRTRFLTGINARQSKAWD